MAEFEILGIKIAGIAAAVPKNTAENSDLPFFAAPSAYRTFESTVGIRKRRIAPKTMPVSEICYRAATELMQKLAWQSDDIDLLIFVTQTPDYHVPGPATMVHRQLELPGTTPAIDMNMGCSGYVYALSVISSMMKAAKMNKALLLIGDTISHLIAEDDQSLKPLFSDAGSATALIADQQGKLAFNLQVDGSAYDAISTKSGESNRANGPLRMDGLKIFNFGLREVAQNILETMLHQGIDKNDIDFLILHQANKLLLERIISKTGFAPEKVPLSIAEYGNTSNASIPLTIVSQIKDKLHNSKATVAMTGFGVGLTWGTLITTLDHIVCPELIEI